MNRLLQATAAVRRGCRLFRSAALAASMGFFLTGPDLDAPLVGLFVPGQAQALVGQPWTPLSGAGVARRTTRRVIRRSTYYVATLPHGCKRVTIEGTVLYSCAGSYYQPYGSRYVVVYVE